MVFSLPQTQSEEGECGTDVLLIFSRKFFRMSSPCFVGLTLLDPIRRGFSPLSMIG